MQSNIRATRGHHPNQSQQMVYIPQAPFPANNVVIQNMYPRPQVNPAAYYAPVSQSPYPTLYIPNGAGAQWQGTRMPTAGPAATRPTREKKMIEITDPNTGKNLTEEILKTTHVEHNEQEEEPVPNQSGQEIGKLFTRLVAETLNKSSEDSNASGAMDGSIPPPGPGAPSSQQYQQPPPTATQHPPPQMMRPGHPNMGQHRMPPPHMMPPRPGMIQQQQPGQPPATPPHMEMMNFSRPPPPLRQPTPAQVYSTAQQHMARHPQQQQQPQPVPQQQMPPQGVRPPNVPVMASTQPPVPQQQQQPSVQAQPHMQQPNHPPAPQSDVSAVPMSTPAVHPVVEQPAPPVVALEPVKEGSDTKPQAEHIPAAAMAPRKEAETHAPTLKEVSSLAEEASKISEVKDDSQGASNRGAKDGRKGKKNKRDFNTKEIGGSEMDAFIDEQNNKHKMNRETPLQNGGTCPLVDQQQSQLSSTNPLKRDPSNPWNTRPPRLAGQGSGEIHECSFPDNRSLNASSIKMEVPSYEQSEKCSAVLALDTDESGLCAVAESFHSPPDNLTANLVVNEGNEEKCHEDGVAQEEELLLNVSELTSKGSQKPTESPAQVESKHKLKKKKKRKGRKSPPLPKSKQSVAEEKENETNTAKPPLPQALGTEGTDAPQQESKSVQEVAAKEEVSVTASAPVSQEEMSTERSENVKESSSAMEKTPRSEEVPASEPVSEQKLSGTVAVASEDKKQEVPARVPAVENQNREAQPEGGSQQKPQAAETKVNPQINIVPSEPAKRTDSLSSKDGANESAPETPVNDENAPPKESLRSMMEDSRTALPSREDSVDAPSKTATEKPGAAVKKDGKDNKLQYDRAYLMELRECASSQTKPEGLPNLEIILDRPVNRAASGTSPDFTPNFFQPSTPQRHPQQMGKSASRGRARPGEMPMPQRIIKSVSIQNDVKALHQSEKPWKPTPKQIASGEISNKVDNLESKALFILNRLTPTNFAPLSDEMMALKIGDYDTLEHLVKIFFDKVTLETKFVEAYAKLCKKMCSLKVPPPAGLKESQATFRVLLLTKCQTEFESDKTIVFEDPEEKRKKLEAELPDGPEKAEKIEKTLYHMKLRRLKFYGNIRFIGELFKLNLLTENIMHDCIFRLLKARDDESLLSLCQLISTVGAILDTDKAKQRMDQYFAQMGKIAEERKSRIKFTLKDAIELRQNNWVPRKEQTGPKKIDEVRQDFQQEQQTKQFLQNQPPPPRNDSQIGSRRGSRQRQEEKPSDDGWNTVGSKSIRIDASKMKFSKNVVDENIQLGPGGGMNKFSMWSRGSGAAQSSQDSPNRPANRFSALPSDDDRRFQRSPSRGDGGMGGRGMRQNTAGHGRGKMMGRSSIEGERRDALASARSIVGGRSQNSSRDNSWNRDDRRSLGPRSSREGETMGPPRVINLRPSSERGPAPAPGPAPSAAFSNVKKAPPKTEEEMEHSAKTIMDEYLNIQDIKEAKLCVMELEGQKYLYVFITASINNVLERSDKDRALTGQFFHEILKDNLLSLDKFIKGLGEVLQFAEDMVIDIPKMWTNLAQLMTPTLVGGSMPWRQLKSTLEPHLTPMCSAKLIAEILLIAKTLLSEAEVVKMYQASGLNWEDFLPADRVADFIKDKKLDFLQGAANETPPAGGQVNHDSVINDLVKVIKDGKMTNDDVHGFIKESIPRDLDEKTFVRLLMTAAIKASLSATMKPNMEMIMKRLDVLQKYIKKPELELQALYAIQALMHRLEHPGGVIANLFETLCTEDVISEEAFKQWEASTEEPDGKGTCCKQLTQFFAWLRENEEPETS
ncbi:hypothetical protein EGW08_001190 [Elysia chlorotica]|uniref:Eukaryotic translation initiation factor 4 gamma 1-like n=1 Tax=Elysia chlorotica TaxID=188477 RepID=A0A3S1AG51_ELYCH|nr:hypothetical protein EGW08_001190 [Elysia chlorotica]